MKITETPIPGLLIIEPLVISDLRGYFFESWQEERYRSAGIEANFIQDNESKSVQGVVRGLHYQLENPGRRQNWYVWLKAGFMMWLLI
jgi:dTDP-4-dehydrorhamnose 3,5-epimerase